ncbi:MAG: serine hydrolase domain-containing protein [Verrucomicrobiota bacterium]
MSRKLFVIAPALILIFPGSLVAQSASLPLENEVLEWLAEFRAPGALIAVIPPEGDPLLHAYGFADAEKTEEMTLSHRVRIGSVSKLFAGYLALLMESEGIVNLNETIDQYLEGVPGGEGISLEDLGRHSPGLPGAIRNPKFRAEIVADPSRLWTTKEILSFAFEQPSSGQWRYSNTHTILLGEALSSTAGKDWSSLLQERISEPLGMTSLCVDAGEGNALPFARGYRHSSGENPIGYGREFLDVSRFNASIFGCAGNLTATLEDLAASAPVLLNERGSLLKRAAPWIEWEGGEYGFCLERWDGFVGHRGDVPGFQAVMARDANSGVCFVVVCNLSNSEDGRMPANEILSRVRLVLGRP